MEMPHVSADWTAAERLALIEWIAHDVGSRAFDERPWLTPQEQFDVITRIAYIASKRAEFCEDNRSALVYGWATPVAVPPTRRPLPPPPAPVKIGGRRQ